MTKKGVVTNYTDCVLPDDQGEGSLQGSWGGIPIKVILDRDFYVADGGLQATAIKKAIDTWNRWGKLRGFNAFNIQNDGSGISAGAYIPAFEDSAGNSQSMFTDYYSDGTVGIWKVRPGGDGRNLRGDSLLLPIGMQGKTDWQMTNGYITGASILLNFDEYNRPGKSTLDVESLVLHELGHVLGLLHSCAGTGDGSGAVSCGGGTPSQYLEAVMYPILGLSQLRRLLKQNDYNRVNCLY